jgi:ABC-type transporter Mla MlaB component
MSSILRLPQEILVEIFLNLDARNKCTLAVVCKLFKNVLYLSPHPELWKRLVLANNESLGGDKLSNNNMSIRRNVNGDTVENSGVNVKLFTIFARLESAARFSGLKRLELSYTHVDLEIFGDTSLSLDSLTHLYLDGCFQVDSYSLYYLKSLVSLQHLDISHCTAVDDSGLSVLAHVLPDIQSLNLSYLFRLTDKGLPSLFKIPSLASINLLGCYRIRSYPWAHNPTPTDRKIVTYPVKELLLGEDSRIQTGGFWLLWCCWSWDFSILAKSCPFLETLRINMVLFDIPSDGLTNLLTNCKSLENLSLVVDRGGVQSLVDNAVKLAALDSLELTCHIGMNSDNMNDLIESGCLKRMTALKFHSKHTRVFDDQNIVKFARLAMPIEYLEINAEALESIHAISRLCILTPAPKRRDSMSPESPTPIPIHRTVDKRNLMQNLLIHNATMDASALRDLGKKLTNARELTLSNLLQANRSAKLHLMLTINSPLSRNLKKLELSSMGFTDKDLAGVVRTCGQLQWCELTFTFTFIHTLDSLALCRKLLYVKLHRYPNSIGTSIRDIKDGKCKARYLASSRECKSIIKFAKNVTNTLRMLDLGGEFGMCFY